MIKKDFLTKTLTDTVLSRRSFLKWSAALGGTAALAGGLDFGLKAVENAAAEGEVKTMTVACYHNCGGRCALFAEVKDGTLTRILPEPVGEKDTQDNPRIIPCLRGRSQIHRVYAPERLKYPMKRVGKRGEGKFERISWEEALDTIASEMKRIKEKYGNESFYFMYASGAQWTGPDGRAPSRRMLRLFGGYTDYYGSYSTACYGAVAPLVTGSAVGNSADDVSNSKLVVLFGDNSVVTRAGGDNCGYHYLKAKQNGARFISIDPLLTDTALVTEAEWIPIRPGTDVALIAALSYVMVEENLYDKEFMRKYVVGFDEDTLPADAPRDSSWMSYIYGRADGVVKSPEWASEITGIPAARIEKLAREIAGTKPCAMFQGWGWQRRAYGEQPVRALPILAAMTGNMGISGGSAGMRPAGMSFKMKGMPLPDNPIKSVISVFMWPDFITRGTEMTNGPRDRIKGVEKLNSNMKFMWNQAGNTVINQHSDVNLTAKILEDDTMLEFLVTVENAMTPSAKFSDIVLPETTSFEVETIMTGEGHSEKGNHAWAVFNHKTIEPLYESKEIYWIAEQLADRLGIGDEYREGHASKEDWLRDMVTSAQESYEDFPSLEDFRELGLYKVSSDKPSIALTSFIEDPIANPLKTASGKIDIYSAPLAALNEPDVVPAIPIYIPEWEGVSDPLRKTYPLQMLGHHAVQRSHSTFDNVDYLREAHPQAFWINTVDAKKRGIKNGDMVRVFNDRGEVHLPAFVTNRIAPGVTSMPQGAWYTPDANGVDTRGCVNVLTKYEPTPYAKGNPQHTNLVQVAKI
jgi:anaerobic dimethyl sulfoxide reductase subunit A